MSGVRSGSYRFLMALGLGAALGCYGSVDPLMFGGAIPADTFSDPAPVVAGSTEDAPDCLGTGKASTAVQQEMFEALNLYRVENGLSPLRYSTRLEAAIDNHVYDLWHRDFFDHVNPDGDSPQDRAVQGGFCHRYVGENIAAGQKSVAAVMQAWENSLSHNTNMLYADYAYVGMGFSIDPNGRLYWGQLFAINVP